MAKEDPQIEMEEAMFECLTCHLVQVTRSQIITVDTFEPLHVPDGVFDVQE